MSYEFGSISYDTCFDMHAAIAEDYMYAGGLNDDEFVKEEFETCSIRKLVLGVRGDWNVHEDNEDYSDADMSEAFVNLREYVYDD